MIADRRRKARVLDIARVASRGRLEDEHMHFVIRNGSVLSASWNDQELSFGKGNNPIAELDAEAAVHDKEEFIFTLMVVPDELSLELDELHFLPVQLADHFRPPVLPNQRQLLSEIHFLHR